MVLLCALYVGRALHARIQEGGVDRGAQDRHPVPARVLDEGRGRVEAHRLGGQDCRVEVLGRVDFEPRGGIDDVRERKRVRLGEAEVGESLELVEDAFARGRVDAALGHPRHQVTLEGFHALGAALGAHGAAQLVGARTRQAGRVRGDAHELLLEERDAQGLAQRGLEQRM